MTSFMINEPIHHILFALWSTATTARQDMRRGTIHREGEKIRGFGEIRYKTAVNDKVCQDTNVHYENEGENGDPS